MHPFRAKILLCLLPALSGCLMHTHKVQQARMPAAIRDADADQLVQAVNRKNQSLQSLSAAVDFQASVGGASKGQVTDYTSLSGFILLRQPETVHVLGLVPVLRTRAFELASDGKDVSAAYPFAEQVVDGNGCGDKAIDAPVGESAA